MWPCNSPGAELEVYLGVALGAGPGGDNPVNFPPKFPTKGPGGYSTSVIETPFGPPVEEIPLPAAPLALVVGQVRFPTELRLDDSGIVRNLHDELRRDYPVLRMDEEIGIDFGSGVPTPTRQVVWRMAGVDETGWVVAVSRTFLSVSATHYTSRADFLSRFRRALEVLHGLLTPPLADRLGIRYISRVDDGNLLVELRALLRPEIAGDLAAELGDGATRQRELVDALYRADERSMLQARWGIVEPGLTYDLSIPPPQHRAFVLDLDVFTTAVSPFSPSELIDLSRTFAERQYRFFRWAVTDEYLRAFGGTP
jgi:uncharacterized protein (TIGR04255 family)